MFEEEKKINCNDQRDNQESMGNNMAQLLSLMEIEPFSIGQSQALDSEEPKAAANKRSSIPRSPENIVAPTFFKGPPSFPYEFTAKAKRKNAIKGVDFSQTDPVMHYMLQTAETHFMSKCVVSPSDWLGSMKVKGQNITSYLKNWPESK